MRSIFLLTIITVMAFSCKSQKNNPEQNDAQDPDEISLLMTDNYGGGEEEELLVIRSQGQLDKFFIKVNMTRKPGIKPPSIDFEKNLAIIYCPGKTRQNTTMALRKTEDTDQHIALRPMAAETAENQGSNAVLNPFGLYIMPLTDKEILLDKKSTP